MFTINLNVKSNEKFKTAATGAVIGFIVFLLIYGFAPLNPMNENFVLTGYLEKDVAQHYAGWKLYRKFYGGKNNKKIKSKKKSGFFGFRKKK